MLKDVLKKKLESHEEWLENRGKKIDLFNAQLRRVDLAGANLAKANLSCADLTYANLVGANLRGADLSSANLAHADLSGADLTGADLTRASLFRSNLTKCKLQSAKMFETDLREAALVNAELEFSTLCVSEKDLGINLDDTQVIRRLYHTIFNALFSANVSEEIKEILSRESILDLANRYRPSEKYKELAAGKKPEKF